MGLQKVGSVSKVELTIGWCERRTVEKGQEADRQATRVKLDVGHPFSGCERTVGVGLKGRKCSGPAKIGRIVTGRSQFRPLSCERYPELRTVGGYTNLSFFLFFF